MSVHALHAVAYVSANTPAAIEAAVHELVDRLPPASGDAVLSAIFASTPELDAAFPATAARERNHSPHGRRVELLTARWARKLP